MKDMISGTSVSSGVERFTVSIPRQLYERIEEIRVHRGWNRSQFVTQLFEDYLEGIERQARLARYAAAYSEIPETEAERALSELSMELLASETP